jgi:hypothetical protein
MKMIREVITQDVIKDLNPTPRMKMIREVITQDVIKDLNPTPRT